MPSSRKRTLAVLALAFATAVGLATTSSREGEDRRPADLEVVAGNLDSLARAASANLGTAAQIHLRGSTEESTGNYQLDIRTVPDARRCAGTLTDGPVQVEFVIDGAVAYIRGNVAFWDRAMELAGDDGATGELITRYLGRRWARGDLSRSELVGMLPFCEIDALVDAAGTAQAAPSGFAIIGFSQAQRIGFDYRGRRVVLAIQVDTPHRPLRLELRDLHSARIVARVDITTDPRSTIVVPDPEDTVTEQGPVLGT